jgi:hypothetical protein
MFAPKVDAVLAFPAPLWRLARECALAEGHDIERDILAPALLEYLKIQAEARGITLSRCPACNATTIEGECVECGRTSAAVTLPA